MVEGSAEIKKQIFYFFRSHWTTHLGREGPLQGSQPDYYISDEENEIMTHLVSAMEVWEALWSLEKDKVLGPDSFSPHFFHRY